MRLASYKIDGQEEPALGVELNGRLVGFSDLQTRIGTETACLRDMKAYVSTPGSFAAAEKALSVAEDGDGTPLEDVQFLPVMEPTTLLDFGLTPRHLQNSAMTILQHEHNWFFRRLLKPVIARRLRRMESAPYLPYYKCNHTALSGHDDTIHWPCYSSYLDIEPELALVVGSQPDKIVGYTIFNDLSARDVQMPEMIGTGPARSKDFDSSNGLGPFLVTPDEVPNPMSLGVSIKIGERFSWQGSSSEYNATPTDVLDFLQTVFEVKAGTVIGMGTIPDCTGLDHDNWLHPGDTVEITFDKLGTLRQQIPSDPGPLFESRWAKRPELAKFYSRAR